MSAAADSPQPLAVQPTPRSERIRIGDEYYLLASAFAPSGRRLLLNHGDTFAVFNEMGDIPPAGRETYGLFCRGTRFLDRFELRLNGELPLLLSGARADDDSEITSYLTNGDQRRDGEIVVQRDTVALHRRKTLIDGVLYEALHLQNYGGAPLSCAISVHLGADFADVFELRGIERTRHGTRSAPRVVGDAVHIDYLGLDDVSRELTVEFSPPGWRLDATRAEWTVALPPGGTASAEIAVRCRIGDHVAANGTFATALTAVREEREHCNGLFPMLYSNNEGFNDWLNGSVRDLATLRALRPTGSYVYAGIPWFATVFGRDGLLTSFETLAFAPELSAGTLRTLAALQGREHNASRDEEPGKILHELRYGEMAATGEIPFGRYYGSIDATPLFLCLLAAYVNRTADLDLARELWPAAMAASDWIDRNLDARGYLSYERHTPKGLVNQGWKDSHEAISHADGGLAVPPIALCEVQGYVYAAWHGLAALAGRLDRANESATWQAQAAALRARFDRDFWMADEGTYALALDRHGQPCRVVASNAGHCLLAGIAEPSRAASAVERLMRTDNFCGWGLRTLSAQARRFNPMSYHNGSVWPHDNALIAAGFARYGFTDRAGEILTALFDASLMMEERRLPELFCGFARARHQQPVPYPVACRPQAWAAGSVFLLLQAVLGMSIDASRRRLTMTHPCLPTWLDSLEIRGLRVADGQIDLRIARGRQSAAIEVTGRSGGIDVFVRK
jgi:glycogen debranching enzyme